MVQSPILMQSLLRTCNLWSGLSDYEPFELIGQLAPLRSGHRFKTCPLGRWYEAQDAGQKHPWISVAVPAANFAVGTLWQTLIKHYVYDIKFYILYLYNIIEPHYTPTYNVNPGLTNH